MHVDKAPTVFDGCKFAAAAQDQRLRNRGLQVPVPGFRCPVLMVLTAIVAARLHAAMPDKGIISQGDICTLIGGQIADR